MEEDTREQIIRLLATSVGETEARGVVERELKKLGLSRLKNGDDVVTLLKSLETHSSAVGLAARLALTRVRRGADIVHSASGSFVFLPPEPVSGPASGTRPVGSNDKLHNVAEVVAMLARSLGDDAATQLTHEALTRAGIAGPELSRVEMASVLDQLVAKGGAVASVARFCKARLLLAG